MKKWLCFLGFLASACLAQNPQEPGQTEPMVRVTKSSLPERYRSAIPSTVESTQSWLGGNSQFAPIAHVTDKLMAGDPQWFAKLERASRAVRSSEASAWAQIWASRLRFENANSAFCKLSRSAIVGKAATFRNALIGVYVTHCVEADADHDFIIRSDTPSLAVLDYYDPWRRDENAAVPRFDDRLLTAVRDVIQGGNRAEARRAAFILIGHPDPAAEASLHSLYSKITDPEMRLEVGMAFHRGKTAESKHVAVAVCVQKPSDPMCRASPDLPPMEETENPPKPTPAAISAQIAKLQGLGFEKVGGLSLANLESDDATYLLLEAGHAFYFDVETDQFPNGHDSLMRDLAALVAPQLDAIAFEEQPPIVLESKQGVISETGDYRLSAFVGGKRYETMAENLDDWYDVTAVLRLMNKVMEDQNLASRFFALTTNDQILTILAATPEMMRQSVSAGLLLIGDERQAEKLGKDFEAEFRQTLKSTSESVCEKRRVSPGVVADVCN